MIGPIFIYSSRRTGGTAFLHSFEEAKNTLVFMDPLNTNLQNYELAKSASSSDWNSNHPQNYKYFANYFSIGKSEWFPYIPKSDGFAFKNSSEAFKEELVIYLKRLVRAANKQNKIPIFKFEQLEGHVNLLRREFPDAIHVGIIRDQDDQYYSWLEQLSYENATFFNIARDLIVQDPDFFTPGIYYDEKSNESVFHTYFEGLLSLRSDLDICINLNTESKPEILEKLKSIKMVSEEHVEIFEHALGKLSNGIETKAKFYRLIKRQIILLQQRDELLQQRNELLQQRDAIFRSKSWRFLRSIRNFLKIIKKVIHI